MRKEIMNTPKDAWGEANRIINEAKGAAPDPNYGTAFALGALQAHAAQWLLEKWQLEKKVEELKQAINEMKTYANS